MNCKELLKILRSEIYDQSSYDILGKNRSVRSCGALCLKHNKAKNSWELHCYEKGRYTLWKSYETEEKACEELLFVMQSNKVRNENHP